MARLSFRCQDDLVHAVDDARGEVARERWLRNVVQRAAMESAPPQPAAAPNRALYPAVSVRSGTQVSPAP